MWSKEAHSGPKWSIGAKISRKWQEPDISGRKSYKACYARECGNLTLRQNVLHGRLMAGIRIYPLGL